MGDIEGLPFFEAIRQLGQGLPRGTCAYVHLTLLPFIPSAGELKTKPTQHSVKELRSIGIQPDILRLPLRPADPGRGAAEARPVLQRPRERGDRRPSTWRRSTRCRSPTGPPGSTGRCSVISAGRRPGPRRGARSRSLADHRRAGPQPRGRGLDRDRGQVYGPEGRLQVADRGADPWRHQPPGEGQPRMDRGRGVRARGSRAVPGGIERHPGARAGSVSAGPRARSARPATPARSAFPIWGSASACRWR